MISIDLYKADGVYSRFSSVGHAEYGEAGNDIVCAAVSVLVINTLNSIEFLTEDEIIDSSDQSKGIIKVEFCNLSHDSILLLDSMVLGLTEIQKQYGRKYITFTVKEATS